MYSFLKVNEFNQNSFNMKNIVGNVWEWVEDWWSIYYASEYQFNPVRSLFKPKQTKYSKNHENVRQLNGK
jgi:formylglycine-generating enzyme required for sulfatase activity